MDSKLSEVFISNAYHALRAVTMPTSEEDIGKFLTGPIDGEPTASSWEGEADDHSKDHDEDEDGGGTDREDDAPPKPKRRKRAAKVIIVTKLNVGP